MTNLIRILVSLSLIALLAGCGSIKLSAPAVNLNEYPYRYNEFDYNYIWKTSSTDKGLVVEGFVKNVRYAYIDSVDINLKVIDKDGNVFVKASDFPMPQESREGELCSFRMLLKNFKLTPGNIFHFQMNYAGDDASRSGTKWSSSFKVDAMTGKVAKQ